MISPATTKTMHRIYIAYICTQNSEEVEFIPAKLKVREIYTQTYVCLSCKEALNNAETPVFHKSKAPEALIQNSYASASTVAWTMYQKYGNSLPLYRQEKDWKQYDAEINRATLANWIICCANEYFKPMYEFFHRELLKRRFAMADETRVQVLKEPGREAEQQSFMWLFRSGEDGLPPIVLYGYSPTRSGDMAANFLKGCKRKVKQRMVKPSQTSYDIGVIYYHIGGAIMARQRSPRVPMEEQVRLINECRRSGMTDVDWCKSHGIVVSTFYNVSVKSDAPS